MGSLDISQIINFLGRIVTEFSLECMLVSGVGAVVLDTSMCQRICNRLGVSHRFGRGLLLQVFYYLFFFIVGEAVAETYSSSLPLWNWHMVENHGSILVFAAFLHDILTIRFPGTIPGLSSTLDIVCRFVAVVSLTYGFHQLFNDAFSLQHLFTSLVFIVSLAIDYPSIPDPPFVDGDGKELEEWRNAHIVSASWWQQEDLWRHCFVIAELRKSELREDGGTLFVRVERNKTGWLASSQGNLLQSIAASQELTDLHHQSHRIALIEFKDSIPRTSLCALADLIRISHTLEKAAPTYSLPLFNCWWFAHNCFLRIATGLHISDKDVQITITSSESSVTEWLRDGIQRRFLPDGFADTDPSITDSHVLIELFRPQVHLSSWSRSRPETLAGLIVFCERWKIHHSSPIRSSWTCSVYQTIVCVRWFYMIWRMASITGLWNLPSDRAVDIPIYFFLLNLFGMGIYEALDTVDWGDDDDET